MYWAAKWRDTPPDVFHAAYRLYKEGRVLLYQRGHARYALKLSTSAKRFVDYVGSLTPTPPMGAYGLFACGRGPDPDRMERAA